MRGMGLPCVVSDIPGNRGMVGEGYPGLFPVGDVDALRRKLQQTARDEAFYQSLILASKARSPQFSRQAESLAWGSLLKERDLE